MMFSLCAIFEDWLIGDGDYPPLEKKQKVNLSFKMHYHDYTITEEELYVFEQIKNAEYNFSGKIIYKYYEKIVVDTLSFKFYIEINRDNIENINVGQFIKGNGDIHVDYYGWVMNLKYYENPPNIFYNFVIENIFEVVIAKKYFVSRGNNVRFPCSLRNDKYNDNDLKEIERMDLEGKIVFYLLNLREINETIERTFQNKRLFRQYKSRKKIAKILKTISMKNIKKQINIIIGLYKWNKLKKLPDSYIHDIFRSAELYKIGMALTHSDQKTVDRFLECSKLFYKEGALKQFIEHIERIISKSLSNENKARIINATELGDPSRIQDHDL